VFQAAAANFALHSEAKVNTGNETRGPLLLMSGKQDHTVPDVTTRSTLKQYRDSTAVTELKQFEGRGHSLTIDSGWREVADATLEWLQPITGHHALAKPSTA
jgi:alpha-beta hydrolase superfamily lysophospholipase